MNTTTLKMIFAELSNNEELLNKLAEAIPELNKEFNFENIDEPSITAEQLETELEEAEIPSDISETTELGAVETESAEIAEDKIEATTEDIPANAEVTVDITPDISDSVEPGAVETKSAEISEDEIEAAAEDIPADAEITADTTPDISDSAEPSAVETESAEISEDETGAAAEDIPMPTEEEHVNSIDQIMQQTNIPEEMIEVTDEPIPDNVDIENQTPDYISMYCASISQEQGANIEPEPEAAE